MAPEERRFADGRRVLLILVRCCNRRISARAAEGNGECVKAELHADERSVEGILSHCTESRMDITPANVPSTLNARSS